MPEISFRKRFAALSFTVLSCLLIALGPCASRADEKAGKPRPKPEAAVKVRVDDPAQVEQKALAAAAADRQDTQGEFYERPMRLYDVDGRVIEARLVSAAGDVITVERTEDGKEFQIELDRFHHTSRHYIELWLQRDVDAIDYLVDFVVRKRLIDSSDYETLGRSLTTNKWVYDVELTNRTRNELSGTQIEFRIFHDDEVYFVRTTAYPGEGLQQEGEGVELPELGFNARAEFTTTPVELDTYRYTPSRGDKEYRRDKIVGIWLRLVKNGELVEEYKSNETVMKDFVWDGEEAETITVKDSFADEFKDGQRVVGAK